VLASQTARAPINKPTIRITTRRGHVTQGHTLAGQTRLAFRCSVQPEEQDQVDRYQPENQSPKKANGHAAGMVAGSPDGREGGAA
jgi:hypothetical protein